MTETPQSVPAKERLLMAAAAVPFLASIFLLGLALKNGVLMTFGIAWPIIQVLGYAMMLQSAKGRFSHPLVTTQIVLHWLVMILLLVLIRQAL